MKGLIRFVPLGLVVVVTIGASKCDPSGERPRWKAQFWAGDSATSAIHRYQDNQFIECEDQKFDQYVCITYGDIDKLEAEVMSRCEKWKQ